LCFDTFCAQDPENEVRYMGDTLAETFEQKYAEFLRQEREQKVCARETFILSAYLRRRFPSFPLLSGNGGTG
jgi:hypothetical protein